MTNTAHYICTEYDEVINTAKVSLTDQLRSIFRRRNQQYIIESRSEADEISNTVDED